MTEQRTWNAKQLNSASDDAWDSIIKKAYDDAWDSIIKKAYDDAWD